MAVPTLILMHRYGSQVAHGGAVVLGHCKRQSRRLDRAARRRDPLGAFLDPIADKLIVLGGLGVLAERGDIWWWPVLVIAARELGVSAFRSWSSRRGTSLPARKLGKYKAFLQYMTVGSVLLPATANWLGVQQSMLLAAMTMTVVSGIEILFSAPRSRARATDAR